jgi:sterol 24-C-methyltransferase
MTGLSRDAFSDTVKHYRKLHDDGETSSDERKGAYSTLVNQYYDLVTDFYEFGWGDSFHFAPRFRHERFRDALKRHERFLARKLRLYPNMKAMDLGCGVGGPMRYIAEHTGADITGVNANGYQIERGRKLTQKAGLEHRCRFVEADFMNLPFEEGSFDAAYGIEATCHAPDRVAMFTGVRKALKPGARFAVYEWCLTDAYDGSNPEHRRIKKEIEEGDGLPDLAHTSDVDRAFEEAGFELLETKDLAGEGDPETPWYHSLTGGDLSISSIPRTPIGRTITNGTLGILEKLKLVPEGTQQVSDFLNAAADALVEGGERKLFTPMYFVLAKVPE